MYYFLYEIAKNQEIQQKLQQEIDEMFKSAGPDGITYEMLNDLKYLELCIVETLRKYPLASMLIRECTKDYKISGSDLVIPKGTSVFIPCLGLHRDPEIYENPMEFKPERFLNSPTGGGRSEGTFHLSFGEGPRSCIAMRMAKITVKIGIVHALSKFNVTLSDKADYADIKYDPKQYVLTPAKAAIFNMTLR